MSHEQEEFAKKITAYLDRGTADLRAGTVYRLQQARARAMARLSDQPVAATESRLAHALAGGGTGGGSGLRKRAWLGFGVLVIAAAAFGFQQWRLYQQTRDLAEIDVEILTSDLPIDAYVDRGFQTWLTSDKR
jgi:hypothetical protein